MPIFIKFEEILPIPHGPWILLILAEIWKNWKFSVFACMACIYLKSLKANRIYKIRPNSIYFSYGNMIVLFLGLS